MFNTELIKDAVMQAESVPSAWCEVLCVKSSRVQITAWNFMTCYWYPAYTRAAIVIILPFVFFIDSNNECFYW